MISRSSFFIVPDSIASGAKMLNSTISHGDLEKYWETVVSAIKDGVMIVDTAGYIVFANQAMESITGYEREELIGQQCSILNCDLFNMAREQGEDKWCVLLRTGNLDSAGAPS